MQEACRKWNAAQVWQLHNCWYVPQDKPAGTDVYGIGFAHMQSCIVLWFIMQATVEGIINMLLLAAI